MVVVDESGKIVLLTPRRKNSNSGTAATSCLEPKGKEHHPEGFAERLIADGTRTAAEAWRNRWHRHRALRTSQGRCGVSD
jgi:hypothetical protein